MTSPRHTLPDWQNRWKPKKVPCNLFMPIFYTVIILRIHSESIACPLAFDKCSAPFHARTTTNKNIFCPVLSVTSIWYGVTGALVFVILLAVLIEHCFVSLEIVQLSSGCLLLGFGFHTAQLASAHDRKDPYASGNSSTV